MREQRFRTFEEFWRHFVRAHEDKATRMLHFAGTTAALACMAGGLLLRRPLLFVLAPAAAWGPAWIEHVFIDKSHAAPPRYPLWLLRAELLMWSMTLAGTMDAEVERIVSSNGYHHGAPADMHDLMRHAMAEEARTRRARERMN